MSNVARTRIVATIGPVTCTPQSLISLRAAGMNVARLNGSHNTLEWHARTIELIHRHIPDVPVLFDIPGRKIRTLQLAFEPRFAVGDAVVLTTDDTADGHKRVPVNYRDLHQHVSPGCTIFADDGTLRFVVEDVRSRDIVCRAEVAGQLRSSKGINLPGVALPTPIISDRDREAIAFACRNQVDFLGISFVESAQHVEEIRRRTRPASAKIVAKIENANGLANVSEIVEAADAVMIDRGDLSVETTLEDVVLAQKRIIAAANRGAKPVIIATEMLHTMIAAAAPTKAEISDITNAVLDGCAAIMLSGETAVGSQPEACVSLMRRIADVAEIHLASVRSTATEANIASIPDGIGRAIELLCQTLPVTKIVAITLSGFAARAISVRGLRQPILAVTNDRVSARGFNLLPGVTGTHVDVTFSTTTMDHIPACLKELWRRGMLTADDLILVTAVGYPRVGNLMNLIQTHAVADLVETFAWTNC